MQRENVNDLLAFLAVERERSFKSGGKARSISIGTESHCPWT
jgi:hypothetical protein